MNAVESNENTEIDSRVSYEKEFCLHWRRHWHAVCSLGLAVAARNGFSLLLHHLLWLAITAFAAKRSDFSNRISNGLYFYLRSELPNKIINSKLITWYHSTHCVKVLSIYRACFQWGSGERRFREDSEIRRKNRASTVTIGYLGLQRRHNKLKI